MSKETEAIAFFRRNIGENQVLEFSDQTAHWGKDWTKVYAPNFLCIVFPKNSHQVSQVLSYCFSQRLSVVPSGGRTGLAAGAMACEGEVIVSLTKMNKILCLDPLGLSVEVEAGCITQDLIAKAKEAGLFFGLDLASKGSCQVGGNISTNAGGLKFIRYGGMREQVLGLEVVLADGQILDLMTSLRKDNSGYDLKQLFIGSEGTLGIITKAILKLQPAPKEYALCFVACDSFEKLLLFVSEAKKNSWQIAAIEYISKMALAKVLAHAKGHAKPFQMEFSHYCLLEVETAQDPDMLACFLEMSASKKMIQDAIVASSQEEAQRIWAYREQIPESLQTSSFLAKNDLTVSLDRLAPFVASVQEIALSQKAIDLVLFGHIGDGNIHINYVGQPAITKEDFWQLQGRLQDSIFKSLKSLRGSLSAEHGIGLIKREAFASFADSNQLSLMRKIKETLDPHYLLNPGKILKSEKK